MAKGRTVAIDGTVASGKTSVGRLLAQRLGYSFLDTGVMYRALTWLALRRGVSLEDEKALANLARKANLQLNLDPTAGGEYSEVRLEGREVSREIHDPSVGRETSVLARWLKVREVMVARQREMASQGSIVMVGRDIGTVVLPHADLKVFLLASVEVRAARRQRELEERGQGTDYERVLRDVVERDRMDSERDASPLRPAPDARHLNTDNLTLEQVVERIAGMLKELDRGKLPGGR